MRNAITIGWWAVTTALLIIPWLCPLRAGTPGTKRWEFATGGEVQGCPAIGDDGTVYIGSQDKKLYALHGATGQKRWEFLTGGLVTSSAAVGPNGIVYAGSADMQLYALDAATGAKRWTFATAGPVSCSPALGADGTVYIGSSDHKLYALDGATGAKKWEYLTSDDISSSPAVGADGTLYVASGGSICALRGDTGAKRWETSAGFLTSSPAIGADGKVYAGSYIMESSPYPWEPRFGFLVGLDEATGQGTQWPRVMGAMHSPAIGPDGTLYAGCDQYTLFALTWAPWAIRWEFGTGDCVRSCAAVGANGTVYVGSLDNKVYALNGATGQKLWEFETGGDVNCSPALGADGTLYVGSSDGKVYALATSSVGGLATSSWPKFRADARNTGRVQATANPQPPAIVAQPQNRTNTLGSTATFTVSVSGAMPLTLQWRKDGVPLAETSRITGTYSKTLTISTVEATDEGAYSVVVSNELGSVTSQGARLTVFQPLLPLRAVLLAGQPAAGIADGPGATAQFGSITSLDLGPQGWLYVADAGNRRIRVVDQAGWVTTLAGTGEDARRDGPAQEAAFHDLRALSVDGFGNCYVLDGDQLRRVGADSQVSTLETIAVPSGYTVWTNLGPNQWGVADEFYGASALVASPAGVVYVRGTAGTSLTTSWGAPADTRDESRKSVILRRSLSGWETVAAANRSDSSYWDGFYWVVRRSGSGSLFLALAKGLGEELLVYRESHYYESLLPPSGEYHFWQYQVEVLGRTPETFLATTNMTPAGMAALTSDRVLTHGNGKFYVLCPGYDPIPVASDRAPQIGLAVDRHGFLYSATSTQVLRFIPASTVALSLLSQHPQVGGGRLLLISPQGRQVRLEQSRDFAQWEPRQTLSSTGQDVWELQPEFDRLFLRAVLLP